MSFERIGDLHFQHEYYNFRYSKRLELKLIPSIQSTELIRKKRISIRNNGTSLSLYGDVYNEKNNGTKELKSEFKLSFALIVNDPYFLNASELPIPKKADLPGPEITLKQAESKKVYYFHNKRTDLIGNKAYLSTAALVGESDIIALRPQRFSIEQLKELTNLSLTTEIKYLEGDELEKIYSLYEIRNPSSPGEIKRTFFVDLGRFSTGQYSFSYNYESGTGSVNETADFYLDNQFYGLRPFAVIDLYFHADISNNYRMLDKDLYVSIAARESYWRYNIINRFNTYEDLALSTEPTNLFPSTGTKKTMTNGEASLVFESLSKLKTKQMLEAAYELNGKHVETLGIAIGDNEPDDDAESAPANSGLIKILPNPKAENLVLEKVTTGSTEETKIYSDLFVYI
jgi:hypothetical protein